MLGADVIISQYAYLCTATHDIRDPNFNLVTAPIHISNRAWVAAGAFVGPGVAIGEGAVVGARACVFKNVKSWTIVGGNPARILGKRHLRKNHGQ
jgi:putative colanic acid biosynthesis acetyltransferase WcaF